MTPPIPATLAFTGPVAPLHYPPRAPRLRRLLAATHALLTRPAWSPRIAEPLSTPRGAAASTRRPGALQPAHTDASHLRSRDQTSAAHTPQPRANCGRARAAPSRHATSGHVSGKPSQTLPGVQAPTGTTENVSARRPPAPRDAASTSGSSPAQAPQARAPNATSQHRWGGVYPKPTLLLSVRGCEWGSKPLSSDNHLTSKLGQ